MPVDDPRGNFYMPKGFAKNSVGYTYMYTKDKDSYYLTYKTPLEEDNKTKGASVSKINARYDSQGVLTDIADECHPITQIFNVYAKYLLERRFVRTKRGARPLLKVPRHIPKQGKWKDYKDYCKKDLKKVKHHHVNKDFKDVIACLLDCAKVEILDNNALMGILFDKYLK